MKQIVKQHICAQTVAAILAASASLCSAEITTDGTVGVAPAQSLNGPIFEITSNLGEQHGNNLFHSFSAFNLTSSESANFSGPANISNIISRVTGGSASSIDGAINSSIVGANLFLINPSGIIFGENASLNISGSFHASTASYLTLADGGRFDAVTPANDMLTIAPPQAFGFLGNTPGNITVNGSLLQLDNGQTLSLVGGDISIQDGLLFVPEGTVQLVSVASAGEVDVDVSNVSVDQFSLFGTISITHTGNMFSRRVRHFLRPVGNIDTNGDSGGTILIRGEQFVLDSGWVFADNDTGAGGVVDIQLTDKLHAANGSIISADAYGSGQGGVVKVTAPRVILETGGRLQAENNGTNRGGIIDVNASESITISGSSPDTLPFSVIQSGIFVNTISTGDGGSATVVTDQLTVGAEGIIEANANYSGGNGGSLNITAQKVSLSDGGIIRTNTLGNGDAGSIVLGIDNLEINTGASIASQSFGAGNAGTITITATDSVSVTGKNELNDSAIVTNAFSTGNGGQIDITASNLTVSEDGNIQSGVGFHKIVLGLPPATADTQAGSINLQVNNLTIASAGQISTQSENAGQAGNISVQVNDTLSITSPVGDVQSGLFSTALGTGAGGNLTITTGTLEMTGGAINVSSIMEGDAGSLSISANQVNLNSGAQLSTSVGGNGNGGQLSVQASGDVSIDGQASDGFQSGLYSLSEGNGKGGDIYLSGATVSLTDSGIITAESTGTGDAGSIDVTGTNLFMDNATISTEAIQADGGNIKLNVTGTILARNSDITAAVGGGLGNGGNINIDPEFVILDNSRILANAFGGNGGNITIVADHFISSGNSVLDASSQLGIDGAIDIISPNEDLDSNQAELPTAYLDAAGLLREPCNTKHFADRSSLTVSGRTGLPVSPDSSYSLLSSVADRLSVSKKIAAGAGFQQITEAKPIINQSRWLANSLAAQAFGCTM